MENLENPTFEESNLQIVNYVEYIDKKLEKKAGLLGTKFHLEGSTCATTLFRVSMV